MTFALLKSVFKNRRSLFVLLTKVSIRKLSEENLFLFLIIDVFFRCDDFYEFACGTFMHTTHLKDHSIEVTTFNSQQSLKEQLQVILTESILNDEIEPFKNLKRFYRACSNVSRIEALGATPATNSMILMGGWPVVLGKENWVKNNWTWQKSVLYSRLNGYPLNYFLSTSISPDSKNSTKRVLAVSGTPECIAGRFY